MLLAVAEMIDAEVCRQPVRRLAIYRQQDRGGGHHRSLHVGLGVLVLVAVQLLPGGQSQTGRQHSWLHPLREQALSRLASPLRQHPAQDERGAENHPRRPEDRRVALRRPFEPEAPEHPEGERHRRQPGEEHTLLHT